MGVCEERAAYREGLLCSQWLSASNQAGIDVAGPPATGVPPPPVPRLQAPLGRHFQHNARARNRMRTKTPIQNSNSLGATRLCSVRRADVVRETMGRSGTAGAGGVFSCADALD